MLRAKLADFVVVPIPDTLVINEVNRNLSNKFVGARRQFVGAVVPCPFL